MLAGAALCGVVGLGLLPFGTADRGIELAGIGRYFTIELAVKFYVNLICYLAKHLILEKYRLARNIPS